MFKRVTRIFLFFCVSFLMLLQSGCSKPVIVKKSKPLMGTFVDIKIYDKFRSPKKVEELIDNSFRGMERIVKLADRFDKQSQIGMINQLGAGETMKVSPEILEIINLSSKINELTDGAFDITVGPLVKLWGFYGEGSQNLAQEKDIKDALELVGQDKIIVDGTYGYVGFSKTGMEMDLSGIAKGYAVDEGIKILKREGVRSGLIDAGGDICCLGSAPDGSPWKIGIKHPRKNGVITRLNLKDIAVATSGDYENFRTYDNKMFSHIIDPKTGRPVENGVISVTVLAPDCSTADALATALSVLGAERGIELADKLDGVEAIMISEKNGSLKIDVSSGLKGLYEFRE